MFCGNQSFIGFLLRRRGNKLIHACSLYKCLRSHAGNLNKKRYMSRDIHLYTFFVTCLLLQSLAVTAHELVNAARCIDKLSLTCVERVRCV